MRPPVGAITRGNPPSVEFTEDELQEMQVQESSPRNRAELAREISLAKDPKIRQVLTKEYQNLPKAGASIMRRPVGEIARDQESTQFELGSDLENFGSGIKKGVTDIGYGLKQRLDEGANYLESKFGGQDLSRALGMRPASEILPETDQAIARRREYYKPLMATKAGIAGDVTGTVAATLPLMFVPGANTVVGGVATGAAQGFAMPVAGDESVAENTAIGGLLGGALPTAVKVGKLGKSLLYDPFTKRGNEEIARMTLKNYGIGANDLDEVGTITTSTGARPTMAEQIRNPEAATGAARLQDSLRSNLPDNSKRFALREIDNNEARVAVLKDLTGEGGAKDFAEAMRDGTAKELYGKAFAAPVNMAEKSAAERGELTKLLKIPAIQNAMKSAKTTAANKQLNLKNPANQIEGLHLMKLEMDDAVSEAIRAGRPEKADAIGSARNRFITFVERMSPDYAEARGTYAAMSKPINQMDVVGEILKRGTSATSDMGGNPRLMPDGLLRSVRDEAALIKQATGRQPAKELSGLFEPEQLTKLRAVIGETDRAAAVKLAGAGPGSATAQRLASQNVLNKAGGLLGAANLQNNVYAQSLTRPLQYLYDHVAEPRIQQLLTEITLNPGKAKSIMSNLSVKDRGIVQGILQDRAVKQSLTTALPALYGASGER